VTFVRGKTLSYVTDWNVLSDSGRGCDFVGYATHVPSAEFV